MRAPSGNCHRTVSGVQSSGDVSVLNAAVSIVLLSVSIATVFTDIQHTLRVRVWILTHCLARVVQIELFSSHSRHGMCSHVTPSLEDQSILSRHCHKSSCSPPHSVSLARRSLQTGQTDSHVPVVSGCPSFLPHCTIVYVCRAHTAFVHL